MKTLSLLCLAIGVAFCAAYGAKLTEHTLAVNVEIEKRALQKERLEKAKDLAGLEALKASPSLDLEPPQERLSRWVAGAGTPFALGVFLILIGSILGRKVARDELTRDPPEEGADRGPVDFGVLLTETADAVRSLAEDAKTQLVDRSNMPSLQSKIEEIQRENIERLVEARGRAQLKYGLGPFTEFFGPLSQGERRLNRAWSALVDQHVTETLSALEGAAHALSEASKTFQEVSQRSS